MKMKMYKFYDTSSLILRAHDLFEIEENIVISSITLNELEEIKTSNNKDSTIKYAARRLLHLLDEHYGSYDVVIFNLDMLKPIEKKSLPITNDTKILASAIYYDNKLHPDETVFVTNDLALKNIANLFFGEDSIESVEEEIDNYNGYIDVIMNEAEMADFYQNPSINKYNLLVNQYINIYNTNKELVDTLRWTGEEHKHLTYETFTSVWFGQIKPLKGDIYQAMLADSFINNKITLVKGPAGSGKSFMSLAFLFYLLGKGKIDKIVVFCNTVATKGSAKLGFYPGTRDEKLLDSQIGNMLASKLGDKIAVEQLIQQGDLVLLPMSDIRGYDTSGMNAGIYITEAQNMDIDLMKLVLQRIGHDSICIIDGDAKTQVDLAEFAGAANGMRRASKVFRGESIYGEVNLKKIHRSAIARIAERM